jgi:hypothetical protein
MNSHMPGERISAALLVRLQTGTVDRYEACRSLACVEMSANIWYSEPCTM